MSLTKQIEIQFEGTYKIDENTICVNPLMIAGTATDDFINSVSLVCLFKSDTYEYSRDIGSFKYESTWDNQNVVDFMYQFMQDHYIKK